MTVQDLTRPVVRNEERNGYHDSDFFAVFFNQNAKTVYGMFSREEIGSTRYGGGVYQLPVTENPNILQLYKYYQEVVQRREQLTVRRNFLNSLRRRTVETKLTGKGFRELFEAYGGEIPKYRAAWLSDELRTGNSHVAKAYQMTYAINELLRVKKFRSEFRKGLAEQVLNWLETPAEERAYKTPLSLKQVNCLRWGPIYL